MNPIHLSFHELQRNALAAKKSEPTNLDNVFSERTSSYLSEFNLFVAHFNSIPNLIYEVNIDCRKANLWFVDAYKNEIQDMHYDMRYYTTRSENPELDDIFYFIHDDLLVNLDTNRSIVRFLFRKTEFAKVEKVINEFRKFKYKKGQNQPKISLLVNTQFGISLKEMDISKQKLDIHDNYNDDFNEVHKIIIKRLSKTNDKGLVLLHGKPGTGKTSYIRHLIAKMKKDVIFLPPNMAGLITNPELITILIDNPNSIFVIEDAENIVVDREKDGNSPVSALLNISDGLLSDCLNIQIVCSFNTPLSKVDSALLRKGRLIAKYEFTELEIKKAQQLSKKLGFTSTINSDMTLTAIYNQEDKDFAPNNKCPIGFTTLNNN